MLAVPKRDSKVDAVRTAVRAAKACDLQVKWHRLDSMLEKAAHWFVLPLVGIAAGVTATVASSSHAAGMLAHSAAEGIAKPYTDSLSNSIKVALTNRLYLPRMAEKGVQRLFAVRKQDLRE